MDKFNMPVGPDVVGEPEGDQRSSVEGTPSITPLLW